LNVGGFQPVLSQQMRRVTEGGFETRPLYGDCQEEN
jgi:hypothetical protein